MVMCHIDYKYTLHLEYTWQEVFYFVMYTFLDYIKWSNKSRNSQVEMDNKQAFLYSI